MQHVARLWKSPKWDLVELQAFRRSISDELLRQAGSPPKFSARIEAEQPPPPLAEGDLLWEGDAVPSCVLCQQEDLLVCGGFPSWSDPPFSFLLLISQLCHKCTVPLHQPASIFVLGVIIPPLETTAPPYHGIME